MMISYCTTLAPDIFSGTAGAAAYGGAIANSVGATITIRGCAFWGNQAKGGTGPIFAETGRVGGVAAGGAIFNDTNATLVVENSSFSANLAQGGDGGAGLLGGGPGANGFGGAIANMGSMLLTSLTISGNQAAGGSGGEADVPGPAGIGIAGGIAAMVGSVSNAVRNSIVAGNLGQGTNAPDISGEFASDGFNLIGDSSSASGFVMAGDQAGTAALLLEAKLGPFGNNGGPTDSLAPQVGSPALDHGQSFGLTTDQRGVPRTFDDLATTDGPLSDGTDVGAVEQRAARTGPPVIISLSTLGSDRQILVEGTPGASYLLQATPLPDQPFLPITPAAAADGLGQVEFIDATGLARRFYRALLVSL